MSNLAAYTDVTTPLVVEARAVSKRFGATQALKGVDLLVQHGTVHALVGRNGAGKSTLISILSGLLDPNSGDVRIADRQVLKNGIPASGDWRNLIATVQQKPALVEEMSVAENLFLGWRDHCSSLGFLNWRDIRRAAGEMLEMWGIPIDPEMRVGNLGPGARQLVDIVRAMSRQVPLIVLDEPTASLTSSEIELLFSHVRKLRDTGATFIYISHHLEEIFELCDMVTVLRDGAVITTQPVCDLDQAKLIRYMVGTGDVLCSVRTDNLAAGQLAAEEMVRRLQERGSWPTCKVLELQGGLHTVNGKDRSDGFQSVMKRYPDITLISRLTDWQAEKAAQETQDVLSDIEYIDGVFTPTEGFNPSVLLALEQAGLGARASKPGHLPLISIDGTPTALAQIRSGKLDATVSQPLSDYVQATLDLIQQAVVEGQSLQAGEAERGQLVPIATGLEYQIPATLVTQDNVDDPGLWGNIAAGDAAAPVEPEMGGEPAIGLSLPHLADDFMSSILKQFERDVGARGWTLLAPAIAHFDDQKQYSDIKNLLSLGANVLVVAAVDNAAILPAIELANSQAVPVVMLDTRAGAGLREGKPQVDAEMMAKRKPLLRAEDIQLGINGAGTPISFTLYEGEIVAIAGLVGSGHEELAEIIAGVRHPVAGRIVSAAEDATSDQKDPAQLEIGYVPGDRHTSGYVSGLPIRENISLGALKRVTNRLGFVDSVREHTIAQELCEELEVVANSIEQTVAELSGGNQQKVVFARALARQPNLAVTVHPTRGIDVAAKAQIYTLLRQLQREGITVVLVSEELEEIEELANRVLVMFKGSLTQEMPTGFSREQLLSAIEGVTDQD